MTKTSKKEQTPVEPEDDKAVKKAAENSAEAATENEQSAQEEIVEEAKTDDPSWVGNTFDPFSANPEGEDPRYGDSFVAIKQEIDKLSDTNYQLVIDEAISILTNEAKDLRVAGYLILGLTYLEGIKGIVIGLRVYVQLLENYFDSSFPQKVNAKITAITWLNNNKILSYLEAHSKQSKIELYQLNEISELVLTFNRLVKAGFSKEEDVSVPELTILNAWLSKLIKNIKANLASEQAKQQASDGSANSPGSNANSANSSGATSTGSNTAVSGSLNKESDVISHAKAMVNYLFEREEYSRAIGINRALNWGLSTLPPNDGGKTRLPPPRKSGLAGINESIGQGDFKNALKLCESMMFEPGGNFLLDLQYLAYTAAKKMQRDDVAKYIALQTAVLLQRFPTITDLKFSDGTAFIQADTKVWMDEICSMGGGGTSLQLEQDEALDATVEQARIVAEKKNLQEGLAVFSQYNAYTDKQRFKMKLNMALMCMEDNRPELALPVLDALYDQAEKNSLAMWDSTLHIMLLKNIQNAIRGVLATASDDEKVAYESKLISISNQICKTDIQQALSVL